MAEAGSSSTGVIATRARVGSRCAAECEAVTRFQAFSSPLRRRGLRLDVLQAQSTLLQGLSGMVHRLVGTKQQVCEQLAARPAISPGTVEPHGNPRHQTRPVSQPRPIQIRYSGGLWILSSCRHVYRIDRLSEGRVQADEGAA